MGLNKKPGHWIGIFRLYFFVSFVLQRFSTRWSFYSVQYTFFCNKYICC